MRTVITSKGFKLTEKEQEKLETYVSKLSRYLVKFKERLPLLSFILKKDKKVASGSKKATPYYYEGTLKLLLPKKPLVAHIRESYPGQAIEKGFMRIMKELQKYKGLHFKGHSDYKNHDSIKTKV